MKAKKLIIVTIIGSSLLTGCATTENFVRPEGSKSYTSNGVVKGALTGAIAGQLLGEDSESTVVGAVAGAVIGGVQGSIKQKQEREFRNVLNSTGVQVVDTGRSILLTLPGGLTFKTNEARVKAEASRQLNSIATVLNNYPHAKVKITGYTDNIGSYKHNLTLSEQRSYSVRNYLIKQGVSAERLTAVGMGSDFPIASNSTRIGRQANRRVTIEVINEEN
ncbi:MAG: OmpA family protein [Fusobacterium sp. JB021]|nr:OmpA family protein [Fusobacterium sp. JB020]MDP0493550.1 OmpA family protein [Fusobacterium sp. JB021]